MLSLTRSVHTQAEIQLLPLADPCIQMQQQFLCLALGKNPEIAPRSF